MATAAYVDRPLLLRARPDLVARRIEARHPTWAVKDPVAMRYYRFRDEEYQLLSWLDGRRSLDELRARFARQFAPRHIGHRQLQAFLTRLHREGLIVGDADNQADVLNQRRRAADPVPWWGWGGRLLAIRFRGIDAQPVVDWLYPRCRWLFRRWAGLLAVVLLTSALLGAAVYAGELLQRLPALAEFVAPANWLGLALAVVGVKVLHELGHALTCRHYGGECHELGLMLLCFLPCLYCDVSDSWMLPRRRQRMAVAAAGIVVELCLAAACFWLWWFSHPGWFQWICLNLVVVCTVGTLLVNGNPLFRFDGYYLLSDACDQPNLYERSADAVGELANRLLGGSAATQAADRSAPRAGLLVYGLAATIYRWIVILAVLLGLQIALTPWGGQIVADGLAVVVLLAMVAGPLVGFWRRLDHQQRGAQFDGRRRLLGSLACAAVAAVVLFVPLPARVDAPASFELADAGRIYVTTPGRLVERRAAGEFVQTGDVVARLKNLELESELLHLTGQRDALRLRVQQLSRQQVTDAEAAAQLPVARRALDDFEQRLLIRQREAERLTLRAPRDGMVLPPIVVRATPGGEMPAEASRRTLSETERDAELLPGEWFCQVGDPRKLVVVAAIEESAIERLGAGQTVWVRPDAAGARLLKGQIRQIAEHAHDRHDDPALEAIVPAASPQQQAAGLAPRVWLARIVLDDDQLPRDMTLPIGSTAQARVAVEPVSIAARLSRWLAGTLRLVIPPA